MRATKSLPPVEGCSCLTKPPCHLLPLRAAWALRGKQIEVCISGKNARRSRFGTIDLCIGQRVLLIGTHQRLAAPLMNVPNR